MIRRLFQVYDQLLPDETRAWVVWAIIGSFGVALLDTFGIAVMMPLMLVATGAPGGQKIIDTLADFGIQNQSAVIVCIALVVACVFLLKTCAAIAFRWWLLGRTTRLEGIAAANMLERYANADYAYHRVRSNADMNRQLDLSLSQVFSGLLNGYLMITVDALTLVLAIAVLLWVSPVGTLGAVVVLGGVLILMQKGLRARQYQIGKELSEASAQQWNQRVPIIEGFRDVRLTSSAKVFVNHFRNIRAQQAHSHRKLSIFSEAPRYILEFAMVLGIGVIALGVFLMGDSQHIIAILGVFTVAAGRMLPTLNRLGANLGLLRSLEVGLGETEKTLSGLEKNSVKTPELMSAQSVCLSGDIELKQVGFKFPDSDEWTLRHFNLFIPSGHTVAIVGSSGAGKSTVLDLILGLYKPQEGYVKCGGKDINVYPAAWQQALGVVSQEVFLINASLRHNIAFGVPDHKIDYQRLREAITSAQLDELVEQLHDGWDTVLGERGVRISGGQRQRIGIARALYRRPKVLVLDEATSALDNLTEKKFSETIQKLSGKLTIVIVAHRLSTVRQVDTVIFMESGKVTAQGSFETVQEKNQHFAHLVALGKLG